MKLPHRLTQHKRFAFRAHPNFGFAETSFMLETLGKMTVRSKPFWWKIRFVHYGGNVHKEARIKRRESGLVRLLNLEF